MKNYFQLFKAVIIGVLLFATSNNVRAQQTPLSEIFFLDLGIVIEPSNGSEDYSRVVDKPSEEVKFKVKKVESGSVYMASSEELLSTLNRLNDRIEQLENSFKNEIATIREKNEDLEQLLADVSNKFSNQELASASSQETASLSESSNKENGPINISVLNISSNSEPSFDQSLYMSGVFAYQREDYGSAIDKFSKLKFDDAPDDTFENILYWMADAYQQTGQINQAFVLLNKITIVGSSRIDDALVQMGLLHKKMGQEDLAMAAFEDVVAYHPDSEYVRLAQMELNKTVIK
ncbi:MAG: tetratricopeptide repeat protein [Candidatus Neomarinimicrobiota bacterium]|nr:tetratricopeptide repeat protein [Candidatus Neomarinimicrobiota bacterium]